VINGNEKCQQNQQSPVVHKPKPVVSSGLEFKPQLSKIQEVIRKRLETSATKPVEKITAKTEDMKKPPMSFLT
jgi:hypothetical protein